MNFLETISERGLVKDTSNKTELLADLSKGNRHAYIGFDGTADSLHVGHLLPIMMLRWFQKCGHTPIVLVGGATTRIGDPSGKDTSRPLLTAEQIAHNISAIKKTFDKFLDFDPTSENTAIIVDNWDWIGKLNLIDLLRSVGSQLTINQMLAKESVKLRLSKTSPMTFMEFNYQILQAYDFVHLNKTYDCSIQMGGSDQWGNIIAGVDLSRKVNKASVHAITCPLVARSDGQKMGKSMGGAVWLSADKLSADEYRDYWLNVPDADVSKFLKLFTELPIPTIQEVCNRDIHAAKTLLADKATLLCHG